MEVACTTQEILDRHAEKRLRTTVERSRTRRRRKKEWERRERGREERRTGTGRPEAARDRPEASAERGRAECTERGSRGARQQGGESEGEAEEGLPKRRSTEGVDR